MYIEQQIGGQELAKAGAQTAAAHADAKSEGWIDAAQECFRTFMMENPGRHFMTEHVRAYAEAQGLRKPPDRRAWGAITASLARRKIIVKVRYAPSTCPNHHAAIKTVWRQS